MPCFCWVLTKTKALIAFGKKLTLKSLDTDLSQLSMCLLSSKTCAKQVFVWTFKFILLSLVQVTPWKNLVHMSEFNNLTLNKNEYLEKLLTLHYRPVSMCLLLIYCPNTSKNGFCVDGQVTPIQKFWLWSALVKLFNFWPCNTDPIFTNW